MAMKFGKTQTLLLATAALAVTMPGVAAAQDGTFGGFATEVTKSKKKAGKVKKRPIVDVRIDGTWDGPRTITEALPLVEENGTIVVHPGTYAPDSVTLTKNVTIRGIRDSYGAAPTVVANGGCMAVTSDAVSARVTDLTFKASNQTCIEVAAGSLELVNSEIHGRAFGPGYLDAATLHLTSSRPFSARAATDSRSALVSVTGGRVTLQNNKLMGGETGVMVKPHFSGNGFEYVDLREYVVSGNDKAGVVLTGNVDATLSRNTVVGNGLGGIVYTGAGHTRLIGNNISNNAHDGLFVASAGDWLTIQDNKIFDNTSDGIEVRSGTAILVGNEIGGHRDGCSVHENAYAGDYSDHLVPAQPVRLLADEQGLRPYVAGGCHDAPVKKRRRSR